MATTKPFQLRSISTGTLKTEDLIPAFEAEINSHNCPWRNYSGMTDEEYLDGMTQDLNEVCPPFVYFGARCRHDNKICACDPGSRADFGFWPDWDAIEELNGNAELDQSDTGGDDGTIVYLASENATPNYSQNVIVKRWGPTGYGIPGPITVMDLDRNTLWSTV